MCLHLLQEWPELFSSDGSLGGETNLFLHSLSRMERQAENLPVWLPACALSSSFSWSSGASSDLSYFFRTTDDRPFLVTCWGLWSTVTGWGWAVTLVST